MTYLTLNLDSQFSTSHKLAHNTFRNLVKHVITNSVHYFIQFIKEKIVKSPPIYTRFPSYIFILYEDLIILLNYFKMELFAPKS